MEARHLIVGFVHRVAYGTLFALGGWHACTLPFGDSEQQRTLATAICYVFTFPLAIIGRITAPYRGMDPFFDRGGEWCDFCSAHEVLWYHIRFAVPVYVAIFYLPVLLKWIARRDKQLFKRIIIGVLIYVVMTTIFFVVSDAKDPSRDIRFAATWFIILAAAAAVAWSKLNEKVKAVALAAVLLVGAWAFSVVMMFGASKVDRVYIGYYIAQLFLLIVGATFLLGITRLVEYGIDRLDERRSVRA